MHPLARHVADVLAKDVRWMGRPVRAVIRYGV